MSHFSNLLTVFYNETLKTCQQGATKPELNGFGALRAAHDA